MPLDELILIIILIFVIVPVGIVLIWFSSRIGTWIFNFNLEIKEGVSGTHIGKFLYDKRRFSWIWPKKNEHNFNDRTQNTGDRSQKKK